LPHTLEPPLSEVTRILSAIEQGDPHATEQLLPLVYDELRKLAAQKLAQEKPGQTLEATALVHEAYLRLVVSAHDARQPPIEKHWNTSGHFFAAAAEAMRRILIDQARHKQSLHQGGGSDAADEDDGPQPEVTVVGETGTPKKKGAKTSGKLDKRPTKPLAPIDFRAIPAGNVNKPFEGWEAELQKYGFAIIHNKIVVIDPFSDNCTVVTGSHNLGFRASHNNDENMLIIRGHRGLAEAYACHVLDIYDHYAWRFLLRRDPKTFGKPLQADDKWQENYITGPDEKSPELRFWLAAASAGTAGSKANTPAGASKPASAGSPVKTAPVKKPASRKPAKKPAAKKKPAVKRKPAAKKKRL